MTGQMAAPGWMYAAGDPPGTVRYWDGSAWQGDPVPSTTPAASPGAPLAPTPLPAQPTAPMPLPGPTIAPEPKRSKRPLVLLAILFLIVLPAGCVGYFALQSQGQNDAAREFLEALASQDFEAVEESIDPSCFTTDELNGLRDSLPFFAPMEVIDVESSGVTVRSGGDTTGEVSGEVRVPGVGEFSVDLSMIKSDDWRVCGFFFDDPSDQG